MEEAAPRCLNCGERLQGPFCHRCGQEATDPVPRANEFLRDLVDEFIKVDSKVLRSFGALMKRPGFLTTEYLSGRRANYLTPMKMYFVASALYFLTQNVKIGAPSEMQAMTSFSMAGTPKAVQDGIKFYADNMAIVSILLLPMYALTLAVLYLGRQRRLIEYAVCTVHGWTASFLLYIPFWMIQKTGELAFGWTFLRGVAPIFYVVGSMIYMAGAYRRVFGGSKVESVLKACASMLASFGFSMVVMVIVLLVFAILYR